MSSLDRQAFFFLQVRQVERERDGEDHAEKERDTDGPARHEAEEVPLRLHVRGLVPGQHATQTHDGGTPREFLFACLN